MNRYNPVNDVDWIHIRDKFSGTVEELKEKAKELPWKSEINNTVFNSRAKNVPLNPVTARPGTVAYLVRTFPIAIT